MKTRLFLGVFFIAISIIMLFFVYWSGFGNTMDTQKIAKLTLAAPTILPSPTLTNTPTPTSKPTEKLVTETLVPTVKFTSTSTPTFTATPTATPQRGNFRLYIPDIDLDWVVGDINDISTTENWGIPKAELDKWGVVRFPHMAYPGQDGVTALAGHRDISGNPFWSLDKLTTDSIIVIVLPDQTMVSYQVIAVVTVNPDDITVLNPALEGEKELRLITCLIGSTKKRVVVFAIQKP